MADINFKFIGTKVCANNRTRLWIIYLLDESESAKRYGWGPASWIVINGYSNTKLKCKTYHGHKQILLRSINKKMYNGYQYLTNTSDTTNKKINELIFWEKLKYAKTKILDVS